ncbi:retrovirus-related pol polyprotein from transposon TNT 1-94 [Tanacetum coccineum]
MLVEMADMRKKAPLGIVRDILVKIDKFLFPSDFVILDQTPNSTVILGRPFLATVHAQISVFEKEISVGIGDERVTFNINRNDPNFAPTEGIFMLNSINTDEPITKRLKISDDTATTHFCKPIIQECDKDFKAWPSCSPFRNKCDGGHEIYRINELGKTKYWVFPNNNKRKEIKGCGVTLLRRNTFISYAVTGSIPINRGLIQAILTSLPPQPIGEATKASNLRRIPPGVQGNHTLLTFCI